MIDPDNYWVNNPLITPINKVVMYDSDIYDAVIGERERIIKFLELLAKTAPNSEWADGLKDAVYWLNNPNEIAKANITRDGKLFTTEDYLALIKGEKTNFETYLEEQLKNPEVKKAFEQGEGEN